MALIGLLSLLVLQHIPAAHAATTIVINSNSDNQANDGKCTLREAIVAANNDTASGAAVGECAAGSGIDMINFAITGTADFTNGGQNGYTISIGANLPPVTQKVTINGYSQTGSVANTAVSPNPFNGRLLIQIDGTNSTTVVAFAAGSDQSQLRGVVISNAGDNAVVIDASSIVVAGNYIGTDPTGLNATTSTKGITWDGTGSHAEGRNAQIGGLNPQDRNIISGNSNGGDSAGAYPTDGWIFQGNYFGLDATGAQALPNAAPFSSGSVSIDDCDGVIIGGTDPAAKNIFSGNNSFGLAPHNTTNLVIQGNYIGTDYTGLKAVPNQYFGLGISASPDATIGGTSVAARNIISGNNYSDVSLNGNGMKIQGNYIGLDKNGNYTADIANPQGFYGVSITGPFEDNMVGGTSANQYNRISTHHAGAVLVQRTNFGNVDNLPVNNGILGNTYVQADSPISIDLARDTNADGQPDTDSGPNPNSPSGSTAGEANSYLNTPILKSVKYDEDQALVNFDLNTSDATTGQYRIEFYMSDTDTDYFGGTFLGSSNMTTGNDVSALIDLPDGVDLAGKHITATATMLNSPGTNGGFGSTSEFSGAVATTQVDSLDLPSILPEVGSLPGIMALLCALMIAGGIGLMQRNSLKKLK